MSNNILKPLTLGAVIVGGLALAQSSFAMTTLAQGYLLSAQEAAADKGKHGSCGEGKCGAMQADSNKDGKISAAEHAAASKARFDAMDSNKDGMVSAEEMKAAHEGKCGEGKCGAGKGKAEGKCGEGKCGAGKGKAEGKCGEGKCGDDKKK